MGAGVLCLLLILWLCGPPPAWAHSGGPVGPSELWGVWVSEPWVLLGLGAASWAYALGVGRMWGRAGVGRGIARWRFYCYCAGIFTLFVALVSPLDPLGVTLFSAHMAQHELLIVVAAPLLVLGTPLIAFAWALPRRWRRHVGAAVRVPTIRTSWRVLTHPLSAWSLHAVAVWSWHAPVLYQRTLDSSTIHALQHVSFFGTALLFWWAILQPSRHNRLSPGLGVLYLFTTAVYGSALGALLTFSPSPWYPAYADRAALWGLSALEDQQLGGLIMWIPFGVVYTAAALAILGWWIYSMGTEDRARAALTTS